MFPPKTAKQTQVPMPQGLFSSRQSDPKPAESPLSCPIKCPHCGAEITPDQVEAENPQENQAEGGQEE